MDANRLVIGGKEFNEMLVAGFTALKEREDEVNKLNVFPIPDGDTGLNMRMTCESGLNNLKSKGSESISEAANAFARGMLLGARGNSGVILSQIFKGIAIGLEGLESADSVQLAKALLAGVEKSYKAVVKPVEGTMLTVFRESSAAANKIAQAGVPIRVLLSAFSDECEKSLARTPSLLAVLKEAGVIDSGGAGILYLFRGILSYFNGASVDVTEAFSAPVTESAAANAEDDEFGYCTEFLLSLSEEYAPVFEVGELVKKLEALGGESIVALRDEDIVKVHVHVLTPGDVLNLAQQYGEFITIKIENMTVQHNSLKTEAVKEQLLPPQERRAVAAVAVADGNGFNDLFFSLGADYVISGGQSMNPSVEDFIKAFDSVNADEIIVLPNNSNIVLTATQAKDLYKGSNIRVIPTKNLPQGYAAISLYNPDESPDDIESEMTEAKNGVTAMEITHAIRDAHIDGVDMKKDDAIAICDGQAGGAGKTCFEAFRAALEKLDMSGRYVMTVFCGKDSDEEQTAEMEEFVKANYPDIEFCVTQTNQQIYNYVVAIE